VERTQFLGEKVRRHHHPDLAGEKLKKHFDESAKMIWDEALNVKRNVTCKHFQKAFFFKISLMILLVFIRKAA
jgi:hypothetical protein